jgi:dipeptidyl aminopeptidase/acylaminoacyl peptidase
MRRLLMIPILGLLVFAALPAPRSHAQADRPLGEAVELVGDGAVLPARVFRPTAPGRRPAVVVAPGGQARGSVELTEWLSSRLAAAGYVALSITWRAGYPIDDPRDIVLALEWLERDAGVDSHRLAIFGHSRGGMSALRTAASEPRLRAVVEAGAPIDLALNVRRFATYAPSRHNLLSQWLGGTPDEVPDRYEPLRAITYADRIHQPVLLIHGTADMTPPQDEGVRMAEALVAAGNSRVRLELVPNMYHNFSQGVQGYLFDQVASLVGDWLAEVLNHQ